ncbi:MAG TPA: hypothetical protein DCL81_15065 [Algoriphagus sp.]|jgi:hypothetical protein|uniref:hypothetical protein n=1 Tax=Algoriphagus sp. TaxID=1872435 RepID=UPI000C62F8FD|nr:hypothetical protein [Algoriphagus sp.]MAL13351.1 hypothetical protein [Algoriphagus sp.]MAN85581.1 hypothetical protein [Algoriphagus sp.]HAD52117.1 hypothetical protein [Algoriphagus sp.]HAH37773.1 hypothetical protein [Algoriphagus sp.]HAS58485.1 hypothetical protein [Algoriphagus sp.]|tara:strand:- start:1664 stop:2002 length:339 start_codon:yes stop_codon:yes gene_type:complete
MKRPTIEQFFSESTTPKDINQVFLNNPELYRYIQFLDRYIDYLEEKDQWFTDMDQIPKNTYLLFVVDDEVKFGQFAFYSEDCFECMSEVDHDGGFQRYTKKQVSKWRLMIEP